MTDQKESTVEIIEPEVNATETVKPETITREDARTKGWTKAEMDSAEKRGIIQTEDSKGNVEEKTVEKESQDKTVIEQKTKEPESIRARNGDSVVPDFAMTPEQEKVFLETFGAGTPHRAMYFRMKNERSARQRAESERDRTNLELQTLRDEQAQRTRIETGVETDAEGNVIDPEEKPLTLKQLRQVQKAEQEEMSRRQKDLDIKTDRVASALSEQEEFAKSVYPDFEATVKLATDLVNNPTKISDPIKRAKVVKLLRDVRATAAEADKYGVDDYTASMIAYELGQLHPDYGTKSDNNGKSGDADPKANGSLTPEQMRRIEENTQRRASSASLPGSSGGKRTVSVEDVSAKDLLKMSSEARYDFKKKHPEHYAKLMRG